MELYLLQAAPGAELFQDLMSGTSQVFVVFSAVFALLNCFFGYRLVKLWSALAGFAVGWIAGFAVSMALLNNAGICALIGVAAGLILGAAAFFVYRAGVFLLCFFLVLFFCAAFIPSWPGVAVGAVLGILVGVLAMKSMRLVLILTSAFSGGMNAANSLLPVFGFSFAPAVWIAGLVLAAAGILVQWKTTGGKKSEML